MFSEGFGRFFHPGRVCRGKKRREAPLERRLRAEPDSPGEGDGGHKKSPVMSHNRGPFLRDGVRRSFPYYPERESWPAFPCPEGEDFPRAIIGTRSALTLRDVPCRTTQSTRGCSSFRTRPGPSWPCRTDQNPLSSRPENRCRWFAPSHRRAGGS